MPPGSLQYRGWRKKAGKSISKANRIASASLQQRGDEEEGLCFGPDVNSPWGRPCRKVGVTQVDGAANRARSVFMRKSRP